MGTRNIIFVFYQGRFVLAQYGQYDGYPSGQGVSILKFLKNPQNIERLKEGLKHIDILSEEEILKIEQEAYKMDREAQKEDSALHKYEFIDTLAKLWPSLSPRTAAKVLDIAAQATAEKRVPVKFEPEFVHDWLNCEWTYVIDLDAEVVEVFKSLEHEHEGSSKRFKGIEGEQTGWVPRFVKGFAFAELLTMMENDFIHMVEEVVEQECFVDGDSE